MDAIPFALATNDAKTIGTIVIVAFIALGVLCAWLMKTIIQKVIFVVILGGLRCLCTHKEPHSTSASTTSLLPSLHQISRQQHARL